MGARAHPDEEQEVIEEKKRGFTEAELEEAEKAARKKAIDPEYAEYVDAINLTKLKLLLKDNLGRPLHLK